MKLICADVSNFGSYKGLHIDFNKGLCLISGPNGSGKSTLCDIVPWIVFGKTSKNGQVDEIRSWGAKEATTGAIFIELENNSIQIVRTRGKNSDLYFIDDQSQEPIRGKDITDTQKLINDRLGMNIDTYLTGSYLHEFSQTSQFFTTTAKVRRSITEQIVDMSLASRLTLSLVERKKEIKSNFGEIESELALKFQMLDYVLEQIRDTDKNKQEWNERHERKLNQLRLNAEKFNETQQQTILSLINRADLLAQEIKSTPKSIPCKECGNNPNESKVEHLEDNLNNLLDLIEKEETRSNYYLPQIESALNEKNPYTTKSDNSKEIELHIVALNKALESTTTELTDIEILMKVVEEFRMSQIQDTIESLQNETNELLSRHFDGDISVSFSADDKDKLEIEVYKDGNLASYTQLSKGQRQMLKLCFGVSMMKLVSKHNSVTFNTLWYDECLDGMSDENKIKAYGLFDELNLTFENIFIVDHSESFSACFLNKIMVTYDNGSHIETQAT